MEEDKINWSILPFCAVLIEGIITYINQAFSGSNLYISMIMSITLGILMAIAYKLDIFEHFNLKSNMPFFGNILTGILISRGSNYIFDLLKILKSN